MKAAWFEKFGPAEDVLVIGEQPQPEPALARCWCVCTAAV